MMYWRTENREQEAEIQCERWGGYDRLSKLYKTQSGRLCCVEIHTLPQRLPFVVMIPDRGSAKSWADIRYEWDKETYRTDSSSWIHATRRGAANEVTLLAQTCCPSTPSAHRTRLRSARKRTTRTGSMTRPLWTWECPSAERSEEKIWGCWETAGYKVIEES